VRESGVDTIHTGECGLATALDGEILDFALRARRTVFTLDSDFHTLMALSGAASPSVVRMRIEGLRAEDAHLLIVAVLESCGEDIRRGAVISVQVDRTRIHTLPIG